MIQQTDGVQETDAPDLCQPAQSDQQQENRLSPYGMNVLFNTAPLLKDTQDKNLSTQGS